MRINLTPTVVVLTGLLGCAGLLDRPTEPIRRGPSTDGYPDAALDADGQSVDGGGDETALLGLPPDRRVWILVRSDAWADGFRARLAPPQTPEGGPTALAQRPDWPALVHWWGPGSPGTALFERFAQAGRPFGVWYDLPRRTAQSPRPRADVVADMSWLAARVLHGPAVLREGGRPVLVMVSAAGHGPLVSAARARLDDLGVPVYWVEQIDASEPVAIPPADAVLPRCARAEDDVRAPWRAATGAAGIRWVPCVSPPVNPRVDDPDGPIEPADPDRFVADLVRARRVADTTGRVMVVDGVGGWRDDRQIDPVIGDPTDRPSALTGDHPYHPYGTDRLDAVSHLLRGVGPRPDPIASPPRLVEVHRRGRVTVTRLEYDDQGLSVELTDEGGDGRYELLLDDRPFILSPGCTLHYGRSHTQLYVDVVTATGERLGAPPAGDQIFVASSLDHLAGQRVEEVLLVYDGGAHHLRGEVARLRFICP